jgi:hypothetical protein
MGLKDKLTRKIRSLLPKTPSTHGNQECYDPEHNAESLASGPSPMPPDIPADPGDTDISFDHGNVGVRTRTAASTESPRSEVVHNWLSGLKLAVQIFEKTLDSVPVPGLKGAIGGILMIVDQFDVNSSFFLRLPASTLYLKAGFDRKATRIRKTSMNLKYTY